MSFALNQIRSQIRLSWHYYNKKLLRSLDSRKFDPILFYGLVEKQCIAIVETRDPYGPSNRFIT
jgi:hypothetical protein